MNPKIDWLTSELVLAIHERLLAEHGGAAGIRDIGLLESALARPIHLVTYAKPDVFDLAAAYAEGICSNHPLVDGNKRVSLVTAALFLECNGYRLEATETEAVQMTYGLAAGEVTAQRFAAWLKASSRKTT